MAVITHGPRELRTCGRSPRKDVPHSCSAEGLREGPGTAASWLRPRTRPAPETSGSCQRDLPAPAWDTGVRGPVRGECRPPRLTHRSCAVLTRRVPQTTRRGRGYNYCPCFPDEETGAGRLGSMARVTQGQWPRWALRLLREASAARVGDGGGAGKEGSWRPLHVPATPRRPAGSGNRGCHVHPTREEAAARTRHLPRLLSRS